MKKLCFLCIIAMLFSGCVNNNSPENDVLSSDGINVEHEISDIEPGGHSTDAETAIKSNTTFEYEELSTLEEFKDADHIYCCYSDSKSIILSICTEREKEIFEGPSNRTESLTVCNEEAKILKTINVSFSDSYITTAVPYNDGIVYVGYNELIDNEEKDISKRFYTEWFIVFSDGKTEKILDSGISISYYDIPHLFIVDNKLCYLWGYDDGFVVKQINDDGTLLLFERTDSKLASVDIYSNGSEYCFMTSYPDAEYATFLICDINGVKYEHALHGKITSFSIMDKYAVCGTGDEEDYYFYIEAIDLSSGEEKVFKVPDSPYCLRGNGNDLIFVNMSWQPYYIDVDNEAAFSMTMPSLAKYCLYYPFGDGVYYVLGQIPNQGVKAERIAYQYKFYRMYI